MEDRIKKFAGLLGRINCLLDSNKYKSNTERITYKKNVLRGKYKFEGVLRQMSRI